jgi:two-component system sensor histidine kinase HydH
LLPKTDHNFTLSRIAIFIMAVSLLLYGLLVIMTLKNLQREQQMMSSFLEDKGLTLTRTFEAGARATLMQRMNRQDPLTTLVTETVKSTSVAYIKIVDQQGRVIAQAGQLADASNEQMLLNQIKQILVRNQPVTRRFEQQQLFEFSSQFEPLPNNSGKMMRYWNERPQHNFPQFIFVGFHTNEFDQARQQDIAHSAMMITLLLLVGGSGLYYLYLSHGLREAKASLANMELYTQNVIESMPSGLITLDKSAHIVSINANTEHLVGKSFASLKDKTLKEAFPTCPAHLLDQQQHWLDTPVDCINQKGEPVKVKVTSSSLRGQQGEELGTVLVLRDMRELQLMEQKLERSRRLAALGQMAAGIGHEIRNPLGTLRGFAQYFAQQFTDNADGKSYAELMISEVDRLNHSISALLQFSRPREPELQVIESAGLFLRAQQLLEHDFKQKQCQLTINCKQETSLFADPDQLLQVIINLLKNSLAASETAGVIELGCRQQANETLIWVKDRGQGMNVQQQEQMFDPFFTSKKSGTGLGLAVSHQIIEQHHGHFAVTSKLHQGTYIEIRLPKQG